MAQVFLSYSHKDEHYRRAVSAHFGVIARHHAVEVWSDRRIRGGAPWREEIAAKLAAAELVVLLVSQHALTSSFILDHEVEPAIKASKRIYPILVRDCDWEAVEWLARLQVRPDGAVPLARLKPADRDLALKSICQEIRSLLGTRRKAD